MPDNHDMHSTGRGGAGNIGAGEGTYADGSLIREGVAGQPSHPGGGDYSAGRGGAGNIVDPPNDGSAGGSVQAVPETATKGPGDHYEDYHTGRAGAGNVHRDKYGGHSKPPKEQREGLVEKVKGAVGIGEKKDG